METLGCLRDREGASASQREGTHGDGPASAGRGHHDEDSGIHSRGISDGEPSGRPRTHDLAGGPFRILDRHGVVEHQAPEEPNSFSNCKRRPMGCCK